MWVILHFQHGTAHILIHGWRPLASTYTNVSSPILHCCAWKALHMNNEQTKILFDQQHRDGCKAHKVSPVDDLFADYRPLMTASKFRLDQKQSSVTDNIHSLYPTERSILYYILNSDVIFDCYRALSYTPYRMLHQFIPWPGTVTVSLHYPDICLVTSFPYL